MNNKEYTAWLLRLKDTLNDMLKLDGVMDKSFVVGDPIKDKTIPYEKKEFYFVFGDTIYSDRGGSGVLKDDFKEGDRLVWSSRRLMEDHNYPVVLSYHIHSKDSDGRAVSTIAYHEDFLHKASENVYDFMIKGVIPFLDGPSLLH